MSVENILAFILKMLLFCCRNKEMSRFHLGQRLLSPWLEWLSISVSHSQNSLKSSLHTSMPAAPSLYHSMQLIRDCQMWSVVGM